MERSIKEILETMCAPELIDDPQESDYLPRSFEDRIMDDLFIKGWFAKREREMR
jgi:hypothetical protein